MSVDHYCKHDLVCVACYAIVEIPKGTKKYLRFTHVFADNYNIQKYRKTRKIVSIGENPFCKNDTLVTTVPRPRYRLGFPLPQVGTGLDRRLAIGLVPLPGAKWALANRKQLDELRQCPPRAGPGLSGRFGVSCVFRFPTIFQVDPFLIDRSSLRKFKTDKCYQPMFLEMSRVWEYSFS